MNTIGRNVSKLFFAPVALAIAALFTAPLAIAGNDHDNDTYSRGGFAIGIAIVAVVALTQVAPLSVDVEKPIAQAPPS